METMLTDGNVIQWMAELKQQDKTLWEKIRGWFKDLAGKLRAAVDAYKSVTPDSTEGKLVADIKDVISILESLYQDALVDASENYNAGAQKNTAESGGVRYMGRDQKGNVIVDEDVDAQKVKMILTDIYNGDYKSDNNYFPVLKNTPEVYKHYCRLDADRSFVMAKKKAYKAMQQKNKSQHALGVDGLMYVIENLGAPDYIVYQNVGEYAGNYAAIIISEQKEIFAAVQLGEYKDAQYAPNGEKGYYNTLITAFYPNEGYIDDKILIPENDVVYDKNEDPLQVASGVTPSDRAEESSKISIRNPELEVKKKFSLREPVERTKNLVALHNLTEDKLLKALDLKANRKNMVYSADAWTPTFPRVEYEADENFDAGVQKITTLESGGVKYQARKNKKTPSNQQSAKVGRPVKQGGSNSTHEIMSSAAAAGILGITNIANATESVKDAISVLGTFYRSVDTKTSVMGFTNPISGSNLEGSLVAAGVLYRSGNGGSAYRKDGEHELRISNHSSHASNFKGTGEHLSIVLRGDRALNRFLRDTNNVIEAVFYKKTLDKSPEMLKALIKDIACFIASGEYHDTAGASTHLYSGTESFQKAAEARMEADAQQRDNTRYSQRDPDYQNPAPVRTALRR